MDLGALDDRLRVVSEAHLDATGQSLDTLDLKLLQAAS